MDIPVVRVDRSSTLATLKKGWPFVVPLAVLIISLILGYTPVRSATFAIFAIPASRGTQKSYEFVDLLRVGDFDDLWFL